MNKRERLKELLLLLGRIETATGADRELDEELAALVAGAVRQEDATFDHKPAYHRNGFWVSVEPILPYTSSIDAALALCERVLPGTQVGLDPIFFEGAGKHRVEYDAVLCTADWGQWNPVNSDWIERVGVRHRDRVLVILAAILTALLAHEEERG